MKKFYLILFLTLIATIMISWLLIANECLKPQFDIIKDVFGVFQIVISIFIAYLLYDRFGTSKKLLDKQNDLIIEFLEEFKKIRLQIHSYSEKGLSSSIHTPVGKNLSFAKNSNVANKIALFHSNQFYTELKIINDLIEHPLFPPDLKESADIFKFGVLTGIIGDSVDNYVFVSFTNDKPKDDETWMYPFDGDMTIKDYLEKIEKAVSQLETWINKETSIKIKLNLN